jgi:hypothetical protein
MFPIEWYQLNIVQNNYLGCQKMVIFIDYQNIFLLTLLTIAFDGSSKEVINWDNQFGIINWDNQFGIINWDNQFGIINWDNQFETINSE